MMISNKCYYALKAMLELAQREKSGPVTIHEIAQAQRIPPRFLETILRQLKQAGYTDSVRGKDGGYFLAKAARDIKIGAIIRLFEGPLVSVNTRTHSLSGVENKDVLHEVWEQAEQALAAVYDSITLDDLAKKLNHYVVNYSI